MAKLTKSELKAIFSAGSVPTEAQFASLIDSQVNVSETSPSDSIVVLNITASGNISASGTVFADNFQSSGGDDVISFTDDLKLVGDLTSSGNISSSGTLTAGNLVVSGTSTFNDEVTIAKLEKLYFDGPSGLHIYSEGTATDENQIILAKTNNLRILNQAHGKDIIFGTENASGTAKTPLTLSGSGDATFGGNITVTSNISSSGNITANDLNLGGGDLTYANSPGFLTLNSTLSSTPQLILRCNENGAVGPKILLEHSSSSPAADDVVSTIGFLGRDDAGNSTTYGSITTEIIDPANGSEGGKLLFKIASHNGTLIDGIVIEDGGASNTTNVTVGKGAASNIIIPGNITASGGISASNATFTGNLGVTGTTTFTGAQVGQKLTIKNLTGTSETLTAAESGKLCLFSDADGAVVTLPDSGDGSLIGVYYDFYVSVAATSNVHRINVADTTNEDIEGYLHTIDGDSASSQATAAFRALNSDGFDAISMDGTTTGTIGTAFRITNIAADRWYVTGHIAATGTPSTPFIAS